VKHPEYLKVGQRLVFREGRTKAVGSVTKILPHVSAIGQGPISRNRISAEKFSEPSIFSRVTR
jgi:hypothetical protein